MTVQRFNHGLRSKELSNHAILNKRGTDEWPTTPRGRQGGLPNGYFKGQTNPGLRQKFAELPCQSLALLLAQWRKLVGRRKSQFDPRRSCLLGGRRRLAAGRRRRLRRRERGGCKQDQEARR